MREIDLFLDHLREQDNTPGTIDNYRFCLHHFMAWFSLAADQPPDPARVTPLDVRQYRDHLKENYKPGTINKKLNHLSVFFRWCIDQGHAASDPAGRVKQVSEAVKAPKWLDRQQILQLLRSVQQAVQLAQVKNLDFSLTIAVRTKTMTILLLNTGLRVSELCDLRLSDITLKEKSGSLTVRWGKGAKRRDLPLNADVRLALREWLNYRRSEGDYLFCTPEGRMTRQLVQWHFAQLGAQLGFTLSPHLLRHTFGKNLVNQGVSLDRVAMLMGHSSLNTTMMYTMPSQEDLQKEVEKISWEEA